MPISLRQRVDAARKAWKAGFAYPSAGSSSSMQPGVGNWQLWQGPVTGQTFSVNTKNGSSIDYAAAAGTLWLNPVIMAAIKWTARNFNEAPLVVRTRTADENEEDPIVLNHPLTRLYNAPCPGFDAGRLSAAYLTSRIVDGNAYLVKLRNEAGAPVELHYAVHTTMDPKWTGSDYLTYFEYRVGQKKYAFAPGDVITFQDGTDPDNVRKGMSALRAALVDVSTDNEAGYYSAAILRNMGIPGAVLSPAPGAVDELPANFAERVRDLWQERFGGDGRGKPLVFDFPVKADFPDVTPEDMALDKLRQIPVDRILAAIGINSTVLHLQVDGQPKFSNYQSARAAAVEDYLIPLWRDIAQTLTRELLPDLSGDPNEYVDFDLSRIRAISEDEDAIAIRRKNQAGAAQILVSAGFDPAESLKAVGLPAIAHVGASVQESAPADEPRPDVPPADGEEPHA